MKRALIAVALLIAGCGEQAVEKPQQELCMYCGKPYERVRCTQERDSANAIPDTIAGWHTLPIPKWIIDDWYRNGKHGEVERCSSVFVTLPNDYEEMIDFATWCQKAHPDVWREYHSTVCDTGKGR